MCKCSPPLMVGKAEVGRSGLGYGYADEWTKTAWEGGRVDWRARHKVLEDHRQRLKVEMVGLTSAWLNVNLQLSTWWGLL